MLKFVISGLVVVAPSLKAALIIFRELVAR